MISAGITPTDNIDNNTQKAATMTFQNVNTPTTNVGGTDFYYCNLGDNDAGVQVTFLNHLSATMDNCDPEVCVALLQSIS